MLGVAVSQAGGARPGVATRAPQRAPWPALREELQIEPGGPNPDGSPAWHICDPVRNLFFRIGWLEFEILRRWHLGDAARIAGDVRAATTLAAHPEDVARLQDFLARHQLVRTPRPRAPTPAWRWLLNNYLFVRVPLVRPQRWLKAALPWVAWLYTRTFVGATLLAALAGLLMAARQWDTVRAHLHGALSWEGVFGFAGALVLSKLLHELGHALMSTRHGVRVGHMGVAFLVMWPMAYTDTGESWKLRRSRHRLAIASAGICAELVLAAWCTLGWAFLPESDLRNALFFLATTAWVLTLAVNASPFMRFDGYYILTDALDLPGLHERAGAQARRVLRAWLPGLAEPSPEALSPAFRRALVAFAFATWAYRFVLFLGIALVVYHAFFKALGVFLFFVEISVFIVRPVLAELRVWHARRAEIPSRRRWLAALLLACAALVLALPWSSRVGAPGVLRAGVEQPVFSPFAARLVALDVAEGATVRAGQPLLALEAPVQAVERDKAEAMAAAYERAAQGALGLDDSPAAQAALAQQQAARWTREQRARQAELQRLQIVTAAGGTVRDLDPLLAPGVWVAPSQRLATVVDAQRWRAEALVPERDRLRIEAGAPVKAYVQGRGGRLEGRIVAIDGGSVKRLPHAMLAQPHGGEIALNPTAPAKDLKPAQAWFRIVAEGPLPPDWRAPPGEARVTLQTQAAAQSLWRRWSDAAITALIQQTGL